MEPEELAGFEKQLSSDNELREELDLVRGVWELIGEQLALKELPPANDRENFITEIIAAIEIEKYRKQETTKKSEDFRKRLKSIMDDEPGNTKDINKRKGPYQARIILLFLAVAAAISLIVLPNRNLHDLTTDYYRPLELENISNKYSLSRSDEMIACKLFFEGEFVASRKMFELEDEMKEADPGSSFIYALSCYETGSIEKSIALLDSLLSCDDEEIKCDVEWYLSLILIKNNEYGNAMRHLEELSDGKCIYSRKASKLLRKMKGEKGNG